MKKHGERDWEPQRALRRHNSGILFVDKAEYVVEVVDWVESEGEAPRRRKRPRTRTPPRTRRPSPWTPEEAAARRGRRRRRGPIRRNRPRAAIRRNRPAADSSRRTRRKFPTPLPDATETETVASSETTDGEAVPAKDDAGACVAVRPLTVTETARAAPDDGGRRQNVHRRSRDLAAKDETKRAQRGDGDLTSTVVHLRLSRPRGRGHRARRRLRAMRPLSALTEAEDWLYMLARRLHRRGVRRQEEQPPSRPPTSGSSARLR